MEYITNFVFPLVVRCLGSGYIFVYLFVAFFLFAIFRLLVGVIK